MLDFMASVFKKSGHIAPWFLKVFKTLAHHLVH